MQSLFVYGSLQPKQSNHDQLEDIKGSWQKAFIHGKKYVFTSGEDEGYPVVVLDAEQKQGRKAQATISDIKLNRVAGWVLTSEQLESHWQRLDEFEGRLYRRTLAPAFTDKGAELSAFVYVLNEDVAGIHTRLGVAKP